MPTDEDKNQQALDPSEAQRIAERRAFLKQLGVVGIAALGAGWASLAPSHWPLSLRDPDGERGKLPNSPRQGQSQLGHNGHGFGMAGGVYAPR